MKNNIITNLLLMSLCCTAVFCNSSVKSAEIKEQVLDSIKRPLGVSKMASLINLGAEDMPVYQWVQYAGNLSYGNKSYRHIYGFDFFDANGKKLSTVYYENMEIRRGSKNFDATKCQVLPYPGDATIELVNGRDTLLFFHVLESDEFKRSYEGIDYVRMPAVHYETSSDLGYISDEDLEFNIQKRNGVYTVTFTGLPIPFKLCSACKTEPTKVSFFNEKEGRVYFIEKDCYLELLKDADLKKIQALRR